MVGPGICLPSRHPPQRLDTPVGIALGLQQPLPRVFNRLPLAMQITQGPRANLLRLQRYPLALSQAVRTPVQAVGARKQLLALLELRIALLWIVGVAAPEQLGFVVGVLLQLALCGVKVGLEIAELGVEFAL